MKILIVGLGLIGGSAAKALRRAGYAVDGWDRPSVEEAAAEVDAISGISHDAAQYDVVMVALPPDAAMQFIDETSFQADSIVTDFCGVKSCIEQKVGERCRNFRYVGCHPMAGREVSGFQNSQENLFDGASMIFAENEKTDPCAVEILTKLYRQMGFTTFRHCTAKEHDSKIAYTSQLAHIVSNAYVKSPSANGFSGFTGGSFQDMTRIAGVDEEIWTRLYMHNLEQIREELERLIENLQAYQRALETEDEQALKELLREGRLRKAELDAEKKIL